jgi:hypothetical protein
MMQYEPNNAALADEGCVTIRQGTRWYTFHAMPAMPVATMNVLAPDMRFTLVGENHFMPDREGKYETSGFVGGKNKRPASEGDSEEEEYAALLAEYGPDPDRDSASY